MKTFACTRLRLCNYLTRQGFLPYDTVPDRHDPNYIVWLFEVTPELTAAVAKWFNDDCYNARQKKGYYAEEKISN